MANTTNYNWETPDDTDLVKDGAAAIRTLGNSIETTTKNLNPETTTGDIAYRSATANTNGPDCWELDSQYKSPPMVSRGSQIVANDTNRPSMRICRGNWPRCKRLAYLTEDITKARE